MFVSPHPPSSYVGTFNVMVFGGGDSGRGSGHEGCMISVPVKETHVPKKIHCGPNL